MGLSNGWHTGEGKTGLMFALSRCQMRKIDLVNVKNERPLPMYSITVQNLPSEDESIVTELFKLLLHRPKAGIGLEAVKGVYSVFPFSSKTDSGFTITQGFKPELGPPRSTPWRCKWQLPPTPKTKLAKYGTK